MDDGYGGNGSTNGGNGQHQSNTEGYGLHMTHNYQVVTTSNKAHKCLDMVNSRVPICQEVTVRNQAYLAVSLRSSNRVACPVVMEEMEAGITQLKTECQAVAAIWDVIVAE